MFKKFILPKKLIVLITIVIISVASFSAILFSSPKIFKQREHEVANVLLFSKGKDDSLIDSLGIDSDAIHVTIITKDNIDQKFNEFLLLGTNVVIIDGYMPEKTKDLQLLINYINKKKGEIGLIFFGGLNNDEIEEDDFSNMQINMISEILPVELGTNYKVSTDDASQAERKTQVTLNIEIENQKLSDKANSNVLVKHVEWISSPLIGKRMMVKSRSSATQIVETIDGGYSISSEWDISGGGTVILYSMLIHGYNDPFVLWPYFNYLMYVSIFHAKSDFSDSEIESYVEWPFSPIPHTFEIILWFSMIGCLWVITIYLYFKMRKKENHEEIVKQNTKNLE